MEYNKLADDKVIDQTVAALKANGVEAIVVKDGAEALAKIKELIPAGASVMNGASKTLEQIGFSDLLKSGTQGWNDLHAGVTAESDPIKRSHLRKLATLSDYFLCSVHALSATGEFLIASNSGSQLPSVTFSSSNLIFVVGAQKIVPNLDEAMKRLEIHVMPLENENMKKKFGVGTQASKILIFKKENPMMGRKVRMIIVKEKLGF